MKKLSQRERDHLWALERAALVSALGLVPEPVPCTAGDRYAATNGEMHTWLRQDGLATGC
jgi:hypothetical protein